MYDRSLQHGKPRYTIFLFHPAFFHTLPTGPFHCEDSFKILNCCANVLKYFKEIYFFLEFGKFHYFLLAVCGLIYADLAIGVTIISFVLPSAECDFQLTSQDKGWLNAAPMFGTNQSLQFIF